MKIVFLLLAIVCFILEAFSVAIQGVYLLPLGLAFLAGAFLVP